MKFGQFMTMTTKKEFQCQACEEVIVPKSNVFAFRHMKTLADKRRLWFVQRIHPKCLGLYIEKETEGREKRRLEHRAEGNSKGPGRPPLDLPPEKKKERHKHMMRIYSAREALFLAYFMRKKDRIIKYKHVLAEKIIDLVEADVGEVKHFRVNFTSPDKAQVFLDMIQEREPKLFIDALVDASGDPGLIAQALMIEGSEFEKEFGY
jgi:hypothetical protein